MKEFERFLSLLLRIEVFLFSFTSVLVWLSAEKEFFVSYLLGWLVVALDYFLLVRFSKRVPDLASSGTVPKSGFLWRFLLISGVLLVSLSLFTRLDFFAIILAVAAGNAGLFAAVILSRKEWREWKDTRSS